MNYFVVCFIISLLKTHVDDSELADAIGELDHGEMEGGLEGEDTWHVAPDDSEPTVTDPSPEVVTTEHPTHVEDVDSRSFDDGLDSLEAYAEDTVSDERAVLDNLPFDDMEGGDGEGDDRIGDEPILEPLPQPLPGRIAWPI